MSGKPQLAAYAAKKASVAKEPTHSINKASSDEDTQSLSREAQSGVQAMEATAKV